MSNLVPIRPPAPPQVELLLEDDVDLTFVATASDLALVATIAGDIQASEDLRGHIFRHVFRAAACFEELYRRESERAAARGEKLHRRGWLAGKFAELFPGVSKTTYYLYRKISSPANRELLQEFLALVERKAALSQSPQMLETLSGSAGQVEIDLSKIPDRPSIRGFNRFIDLKRAAGRPAKKTRQRTRRRKQPAPTPQLTLAKAIASLELDGEFAAMLAISIQAAVRCERLLPALPQDAPIRVQLQAARARICDDIAAFAELVEVADESTQALDSDCSSADEFYA